MAASRTIETRVLILTELSADARRLADLVRDARVTAKITNENDLATDLRAGVGLLVATDETLSIPVLSCIKAWGDEQPEWSALPVLALVHPRDELVEPLRYLLAADDMAGCTVTVLDRPAQPDVLKNAIKSGLQSRRRQYRIRDQIVALDKEKEHTEFLAREIQHRAKNNIAILQGLLGRLGDRTTDIDDLIERFGTRAAAVARTIDVLCRKHWRGSDLEDLLTAELKALSPGTPSDFRLNGEAFELTADATFALHLVFHELATNALKHGAFAETGGNVTVCWTTKNRDGGTMLDIEWRERDGPPVISAPLEEGFGSELIRMTVTRQLRGRADFQFNKNGLRCRLEIPVEKLAHRD